MKNLVKILISDDDPFFCKLKRKLLEEEGYEVEIAGEPGTTIEKVQSEHFDLVLLDLKFKDKDGIEILKEIKNYDPDIMVIMITGYATLESAVNAVKLGAYDYLSKEIKNEELLLKIQRALEKKKDSLELRDLKAVIGERYGLNNIIGKNKKMQEVYDLINSVCNTDSTVLIRGETGTGKELVAKAIHFNSPRAKGPFVPINCAAITETLMESELFGHEKGAFTGAYKTREGKIEYANGGSLFLDEIADMSISLQAKILRFIQDKSFERVGGNVTLASDVRIIAATNKNLQDMIKQGKFREDLFYRINVMQINMPPLRDRLDDLPLLIEHFIKQSNNMLKKNIKGIDEEAREILASYNWPGNVRELENLIERLVLMSPPKSHITKEQVLKCLPVEEKPIAELSIDINQSMKEVTENLEKDYLVKLLHACEGNILKASSKAGIDRKTLYAKMQKYGLNKRDFKG